MQHWTVHDSDVRMHGMHTRRALTKGGKMRGGGGVPGQPGSGSGTLQRRQNPSTHSCTSKRHGVSPVSAGQHVRKRPPHGRQMSLSSGAGNRSGASHGMSSSARASGCRMSSYRSKTADAHQRSYRRACKCARQTDLMLCASTCTGRVIWGAVLTGGVRGAWGHTPRQGDCPKEPQGSQRSGPTSSRSPVQKRSPSSPV